MINKKEATVERNIPLAVASYVLYVIDRMIPCRICGLIHEYHGIGIDATCVKLLDKLTISREVIDGAVLRIVGGADEEALVVWALLYQIYHTAGECCWRIGQVPGRGLLGAAIVDIECGSVVHPIWRHRVGIIEIAILCENLSGIGDVLSLLGRRIVAICSS